MPKIYTTKDGKTTAREVSEQEWREFVGAGFSVTGRLASKLAQGSKTSAEEREAEPPTSNPAKAPRA